jgi:hypothetical protein
MIRSSILTEEERQEIIDSVQKVESLFTQVIEIHDVLVTINEYQDEVYHDLARLTYKDFVRKWLPTFNRVMKIKAFL